MKHLRTFLLIVFVHAVAILYFGCDSRTKPALKIDPAPTLKGQRDKDAKVVEAAGAIDNIVVDSPVLPAVREQTAAIRAAVAAAPAEEVVKLVATLMSENARLSDTNTTLTNKVTDLESGILKNTARWIIGASLIILVGCTVYLLLSPSKLTAAGNVWPGYVLGLLGIGLARIITHPWFMPACGIAAGVGVAIGLWWGYKQYKAGKLTTALEEKSTLAASTLGKIVPAIDDIYDQVQEGAVTTAKEVFTNLYALLTGSMTTDEKAEVHTVRAEVKTTAST